MRDMENFCAILGVGQDFNPDDLRKAYLKRALGFHPDKRRPEEAAAAAAEFSKLRHAYDVLRKKRKTGDEEIARKRVEHARKRCSKRLLEVYWPPHRHYPVERLQQVFKPFGVLEAVVIDHEQQGSALVLMKSNHAARLAFRGLARDRDLLVVPIPSDEPTPTCSEKDYAEEDLSSEED